MGKPVVASYCTTFLKQEMLHIYRQVTGFERVRTFILTKQRQNEKLYPFSDVEILPRPRVNFLVRFYLKYIRRMEPVFYRGEYDQLAGALAGRHADLLHIYFGHTGVHLLPFLRNWPGPSLVSFHGMDIMQRPGDALYNQRLRELLQVLPMVLARSESLADRLVELGCSREKIRINRTGIPMDQFSVHDRDVPADGAWHFVQAARFIAKKGMPDTLSAFAQFLRSHPRARLTLAGEGPLLDEMKGRAAQLGISDAVGFPGFLPGEKLIDLYRQAHLFVHPSIKTPQGDQEGVPNSMLEAMATGLPVLATLHGGIQEATVHGEDAILVEEGDADGLASAMKQATQDPNLYCQMARAAAQNVREKFDQRRSVAQLESYYLELIA